MLASVLGVVSKRRIAVAGVVVVGRFVADQQDGRSAPASGKLVGRSTVQSALREHQGIAGLQGGFQREAERFKQS